MSFRRIINHSINAQIPVRTWGSVVIDFICCQQKVANTRFEELCHRIWCDPSISDRNAAIRPFNKFGFYPTWHPGRASTNMFAANHIPPGCEWADPPPLLSSPEQQEEYRAVTPLPDPQDVDPNGSWAISPHDLYGKFHHPYLCEALVLTEP